MNTCFVEACDQTTVGRGLCSRHYQRLRNTGSPTGTSKKSMECRFWEKVSKSKCWNWMGAPSSRGYGMITDGTGKPVLAHRYSYELLVGPIPDGLHIDHKCHNTMCVNPEHLRPVDPKRNAENHQGPRVTNKCGVLGVYQNKRTGKYVAEVTHHGAKHRAGTHATLAEAESAVVKLRNLLFTHNDFDRN